MARSDVVALLSTLLDRLIDDDDGFWIDIICVNFIRSRRGAGARGSRIHAVLGDSFCGGGGVVAVVVVYTGGIICSTIND